MLPDPPHVMTIFMRTLILSFGIRSTFVRDRVHLSMHRSGIIKAKTVVKQLFELIQEDCSLKIDSQAYGNV